MSGLSGAGWANWLAEEYNYQPKLFGLSFVFTILFLRGFLPLVVSSSKRRHFQGMPLLSLLGNPIVWAMEESNEQAHVSSASHTPLSPTLCGPLNNSKKAKLLCVINPRWEQSASPPCKYTTTKHSGSPWQKKERLTGRSLAWAVWWFLPRAGSSRELSDLLKHAAPVQILFLPHLWRQPNGVTGLLSNTPNAISKGFGKGLLILQNQGSLPALWRRQPLCAAPSSAHTGPVHPAVSGSVCRSWTVPLPKPVRDSQTQQRSQHPQMPQHRRSKAETCHSSGTCFCNTHGFNSQYLAHD